MPQLDPVIFNLIGNILTFLSISIIVFLMPIIINYFDILQQIIRLTLNLSFNFIKTILFYLQFFSQKITFFWRNSFLNFHEKFHPMKLNNKNILKLNLVYNDYIFHDFLIFL
jgi:hypothetical protein